MSKRNKEDLRKLAVIRQTLAQESSPCAFCKRKICNDPCIPQRDYFRGQRRKTPASDKSPPGSRLHSKRPNGRRPRWQFHRQDWPNLKP